MNFEDVPSEDQERIPDSIERFRRLVDVRKNDEPESRKAPLMVEDTNLENLPVKKDEEQSDIQSNIPQTTDADQMGTPLLTDKPVGSDDSDVPEMTGGWFIDDEELAPLNSSGEDQISR